MSSDERSGDSRLPMLLAMAGSAAMLAHQVSAKAVRDGFFLQNYAPQDLPKMVVGAAVISILLAVAFSRVAERYGPARLVPALFLLSGGLHVAEWFAMAAQAGLVSILVYLHVVGLGAILLSGFWLLLSEVFDPREAKRRYGRIAGLGTVGGIVGGVAAERMAAWGAEQELLLLLGGLHLLCAAISMRLDPAPSRSARAHERVSAAAAFRQTPLLWQLAALVLLGTSTAALLDYLFKLGATMAMGKGPELVRYFAFYYTACQMLTFVVQTFAARPAVESLGVARSVASLPALVGTGATVALLVPVYPLVVALRAVEVILRGSLFRYGYEFLYTPVPPADKRAVKTIIDVGFDRLGDAAGAGAVQVMIWLGPALARPEILGTAMVLSAIGTTLALRLDRSYRGVLERGLLERARDEDPPEAGSILNTFFDGLPALPRNGEAERPKVAIRPAIGDEPTEQPHKETDHTVRRLAALRSRNAERAQRALLERAPWDPLLVPQVIRLLAWDEVSAAAREYLERGGERILGQVMDALTDQDLEYRIRRRLPRLLARMETQESVDGLMLGLRDPRFEIRYECGRALEYVSRRHPDLDFRESRVWAAAGSELAVSQPIWQSRRRVEEGDPAADEYAYLDNVLRDRADRSLEHVFSLFALRVPREPLMSAFRALHHGDRMYRGLALEYLETVLPEEIRRRLWEVIEESPPEQPADPADLTRSLLEFKESRQGGSQQPPASHE